MATTIHDILSEITSFVPVKPEALKRAQVSDITDKNNPEFKALVKGWCNGDYDNDPDILRDRILTLLNE